MIKISPMKITCQECGSEFEAKGLSPENAAKRKFCNRECWRKNALGPNNPRRSMTKVSCHHCGVEFQLVASRIREFNYCCLSHARVEHRKKVNREKAPNWKGGALNGRGQAWERIRLEVIASQGAKCQNCGMTNEQHKKKYRRSLTVHHIRPFRLSLDNSHGNLKTLCLPCHSREEADCTARLTDEEKAVMAANTAEAKSKGLDPERVPWAYDLCPSCHGRKARKAEVCRKCKSEILKNANPKLFCTRCGIKKNKATSQPSMCRKCSINSRRKQKKSGVDSPRQKTFW